MIIRKLSEVLSSVNTEAVEPRKTVVELCWRALEPVRSTNKALRFMNQAEQIEFLRIFLSLWFDAHKRSDAMADLESVLGEGNREVIGRRLLYTISPNGEQLRCWEGIPGGISHEHVDSNGQGLVFSVLGTPDNVREVAGFILRPDTVERVVCLPNGAKIYGFFWR